MSEQRSVEHFGRAGCGGGTEGDCAWSDEQLELFHDGELGSELMGALSEALRASPELRARLAGIARADAVVLRVLASESSVLEPVARGAGVTARIGPARLWWAAAAAVVVLVGAAMLVRSLGPGGLSGVNGGAEGSGQVAQGPGAAGATEPYQAVRVVFSLPIRREDESKTTEDSIPVQEERPDVVQAVPASEDFLQKMDEALATGQVDRAIELLKSAQPGERHEAYRRFGAALRSSNTAMAVLDALGPLEQVEACKQWIAGGQQRPFAMDRLRMLGRRREMEEPVRVAVRQLLADDPNLRTWVMSYVPWAVEKAGAGPQRS